MSSSRPMHDGKHHDKPSHKFSSKDATAAGASSSSSISSSAAAAASQSHAMRTYVTEPRSAGNRNFGLDDGQPRTDAEVVSEAEKSMQTQLDEFARQFAPRQ